MPTASEHQTAKARERELIGLLHKACDDYEDWFCEQYQNAPATRDEARELAASADDLGEALGAALWADSRRGGSSLDNLDFAAEAICDYRHAIISVSARLWLHRKRHERSAVKARLDADLAVEAV